MCGKNERLLSFVPRRIVDPRSRRRMLVPEDDFNHISNARIAKELSDRGVSVQLGAHGQMQGLGAHWELWSFVQGGMTALQALRCATLNGARYLGMDRDLGSLKAGKLADVIVLEKDPLQDIRNSETVRYTIINGRMFDARTMDETGNHPAKRKPLFFENENRMVGK
jgi:imidazolonepropionase-like amidohydrolase